MEPSRRTLGPLWGYLGGLLGDLGAPLGPSWAVGRPKRSKCQNPSTTNGKSTILASSGLPGGLLGGFLGRLGAVLGASWTVLERRKAEKARRQKTSEKQIQINDFGLFGPSWVASWRPLGACWGPPAPLGKFLGPSQTPGGRLRGGFGPSWAARSLSDRPGERFAAPQQRPRPRNAPTRPRRPRGVQCRAGGGKF